MYMSGFLINSFIIAVFVFFVYTLYSTDQASKFISLDPSSGSCTAVPKSITGTYYGTWDGYGSGTVNFQGARALYSLQLNNFYGTLTDYENMMNSFLEKQIIPISIASVNHNLILNLLVWMGFSYSFTVNNSPQTLQLLGDPSVVFAGTTIIGSIASPYAVCPAFVGSSFDINTATFTTQFDITEYNKSCSSSILNIDYLQYSGNSRELSELRLDSRSLVTAMAVNLELIDYALLVDVTLIRESYFPPTYEFNHSLYEIFPKYNPRYLGMETIYCYHELSSNKSRYNFDTYAYYADDYFD